MKKLFRSVLILAALAAAPLAIAANTATVTLGSGVNLSVTGNYAVGNFGNASAITVGASPFSYTNATTQKELVTVVGGTVSAVTITRNGQTTTSTGAVAGPFLLAPTDVLVVTYSVAPTMNLIPE